MIKHSDGSISELPIVKLGGITTEKQQSSLFNATEFSKGEVDLLVKVLTTYIGE